MMFDAVITQLRARAPSFAQRIAGSAKFEVLPQVANLVVPAAYVLPLSEQPLEQASQNGYRQAVRDEFAVVIALSNRTDERGQTATQQLHALRAELFKALLAFQPSDEYDAIQYEGGQLVHMDRARLYYQFEFSAQWEIGESDTWIVARNAELGPFSGVNLKVDAIDPRDPNRAGTGPDGVIDAGATINLPQ